MSTVAPRVSSGAAATASKVVAKPATAQESSDDTELQRLKDTVAILQADKDRREAEDNARKAEAKAQRIEGAKKYYQTGHRFEPFRNDDGSIDPDHYFCILCKEKYHRCILCPSERAQTWEEIKEQNKNFAGQKQSRGPTRRQRDW